MRPLDQYPTSFGNQRASVAGVNGPAAYVLVVPASPVPTVGGQIIEAVAFGLKFFDIVIGGMTDSGNFRVDAIPVVPTRGTPQSSTGPTYRLEWTAMVTATVGGEAQTRGAQAAVDTDLSAEVARLFVLGPK